MNQNGPVVPAPQRAPEGGYPPPPVNLMWEHYARPLIDEHRARTAAAARLGSLTLGRKVGKRAAAVARRQAAAPFAAAAQRARYRA